MDEIKKSKGRPKGSKNQSGLSLDRRLKILSKIACDKNGKPTDVINACKEITSLLNDRIVLAEAGIQATIIKFETNKKEEENNTEQIKNNIEQMANTTTSTTTTLINTDVLVDSNANHNVMTIEIPKENADNVLNLNFVIEDKNATSNN